MTLGYIYFKSTFLRDLDEMAKADGNFIVANGTKWVAESGATARSSLSLGDSDTPTFGGLTITNAITEFSTDGTLGDNSDSAVPTEKAVKTYTIAVVSADYSDKNAMQFRTCDAVAANINSLYGYNFATAAIRNMHHDVVIPGNMKADSDIEVIMVGCPTVLNDTGSDKGVVFRTRYNYGRNGAAVGAEQSEDDVVITIPNTEAANTIHRTTLATISGLQAGDVLSLKATRQGTDELDTWGSNWFVHIKFLIQYTGIVT